ncbi:MAG: JAB domain-containing protein [Pseudomonadota bacterium]
MTQILQKHSSACPSIAICKEAGAQSITQHLRKSVFSNCTINERFHAIFIDRNRNFIDEVTFYSENISKISLRMRDLFARALSVGSGAIIISHNHPSGDCRPSVKDIQATARICAIAGALDIELVDHLIFTSSSLYSMRARGDL